MTKTLDVSTRIYCRTMFCQRCFDRNVPSKGDIFILFGSTHRGFTAYRVESAYGLPPLGFTPHLIKVQGPTNEGTRITASCAIHGCGVKLSNVKDGNGDIEVIEESVYYLAAPDFRSMIKNPWLGYHLAI